MISGVTLVSAHRGGVRVEGQTAAERYAGAVAMGVDFVEFDVRKTRDGVSIVYHDDRTESGRAIRNHEYRELTDELGAEALTFDALLDIAAGKVGLHLDLKEAGYEDEIVTTALARTPLQMLVITSDDEVVRTIKERYPEVRAGLSLGDELAGASALTRFRVRLSEAFPGARVKRSRADLVAVHRQLADFNVLRYSSRARVPAWVWTVDEETTLRRFMADSRVETVITNRPDLAIRIRGRQERE